MADIHTSEGVVIESLLKVVDNLTERELRSVLLRIFNWYKVSLENADDKNLRFRSVVTYRFLNEYVFSSCFCHNHSLEFVHVQKST